MPFIRSVYFNARISQCLDKKGEILDLLEFYTEKNRI